MPATYGDDAIAWDIAMICQCIQTGTRPSLVTLFEVGRLELMLPMD